MANVAKEKKAKKAWAREELEKLCRSQRKAGLPEAESPEPSISGGSEGDEGEDPSWLNELLEEDPTNQGDSVAPRGGRRF